ncbi:MAG: CDP-alcohol phosphatidyltransferase family protein, partial [Mycobacterium sp.]|nr:CDP-alcohol phosphatidyltransferase family protein [Mycobacterium sp.]
MNRARAHDRLVTVPNLLSGIRLALIPVFVYLLVAVHADAWAVVILMFSGASDWADGKIARLLNQSSKLGEYLDPAVDRLY